MQRLLGVCVCLVLAAARDYIEAVGADCGGTPILAWDADSSNSNTGQTNSLVGCQGICESHPECSGVTFTQGQCWWNRAPLSPFPAPNKTCLAVSTAIPGVATSKCTKPNEWLRLQLLYTDAHPDVNKRMMHYEFSGVSSNCLWRSYTPKQVLSPQCMAGKWLILLGGSNHHQYSEGVMQFFNPCQNGGVFPCDIRKWYWNNTMDNSQQWRLWTDLVISPTGEIISFRTSTSLDLVTENANGPYLNDASVARFLNYTAGLVIPPGSTRFTWVRTRWFPFVFPTVDMMIKRAWPSGPKPVLHLSIGRWYQFTPVYPATAVPGHMAATIRDIKQAYPDIKQIFIEDDPGTEGSITQTIEASGPPAYELRARDLPSNVNRDFGSFIYSGHRTNALHSILLQRFWNLMCTTDNAQPIFMSRMILPDQPCEPNDGDWMTQSKDWCEHTPLMFTAASGAVAAVQILPQKPKALAAEDGGVIQEEDNLPGLRNPGNSFAILVSIFATLILIILYVMWLFPTLAFLTKFYCCPRFCGCHKRELKVLARPEEVQEEGYEEVDLTANKRAAVPPPRPKSNSLVGRARRATTVLSQVDAKPDYLGPNVKKRFMGGLEGYDFVGDDCQFEQSGLQQHARKSVAPSAMNKLGQKYGTGKYGTGKYGTGNGLKVGSGPSGAPPPPPPPPPPPAPPGGAAVELQQHEGGHQAEYQPAKDDTAVGPSAAPPTTIADPVKAKASRHTGPGGQKRHLDAFGFARYAASVHVVCGHLYNKHPQPVEDWYTSDWGFTWVPWFMMLSGFILTYARLGSSRPDKLDPAWTFTIQRARSVYPLYLSSLFCAAALDAYIKSAAFTLGSWRETLMSILMLQAWDPYVTEHTYQSHCWFLSCILPYWMIHNVMYRALKTASDRVLWAIAAFVSLWPWIFLMLIPAAMGDVNWYRAHDWGKTDTATDILVVMLKFHPIFYLPVYVFGMVIAVLFVRKGDDLNWVVRHGAALGYFGLFLVFVVTPWMGTAPYAGIPASKLTCRLGVLAPLQGLSLIGLAVGTDPVARLFSWLPLQIGERISFPQYVFQFIVFTIWSQYTGLGYWSLLICFSLAGAILIQEPLARPTKDKKRKIYAFIWMCLFPLICVLLLIISGNAIFTPPPGHLPDFVSYNAEAYDTKLTLMSKPHQLLDGKYGEGQFAYINPSFLTTSRQELQNFTYGNVTNQSLVTVQDLWVTARRFRLDVVTVEGSVEATENGMPIYRAPVCQWFDPQQGCENLVVTPATNEADCEAICCGLANCRVYQWVNAIGASPQSCGLLTSNTVPNCTGSIPSGLGKSGIKLSPLLPFNSTANTNTSAFWRTINATATITSTWRSDIVFGTLDQNTMRATCPLEAIPAQSNVGGANGVWYPCTPYAIYAEANGTMFQLIATGPEDARLFLGPNGDFLVSFNSNLPQTLPSNTTGLPVNCPGGSSTQFFTSSFPAALRNTWRSYSHGQCPAPPTLSNVTGSTFAPTPQYSATMGPAVQYTLDKDLRIAQKNWIFLPKDPSVPLFVTSLNPVEIVSVNSQGQTNLVSSYRNVKLSNTAAQFGVVFHGGSNAILVKSQPIPASAVTWSTNATNAPTPAPAANMTGPDPCLTPFTSGSYSLSDAVTPAKCDLNGGSFTCTGGWTGTASVTGANQITFPDLFGSTNVLGYWMRDPSGNCNINLGKNRYWSYQPVPPAPKPPAPPITLTPQQQAFKKYYYLTRPDFFLAGFHSVDGAGRYRNYLAEFETSHPYKIIRLSVALPLLEYPVAQPGFNHGVKQKMAFLSTIAELQNGDFAFGYGSSNYQARALVLSRVQYETMFSDPIPVPK